MNRMNILTLLLTFLMANCQNKIDEKKIKAEVKTTINGNEYKSVALNNEQVENNNNNLIYKIDKYKLYLDLNNETSKIEIDGKLYSINFNFFYDADLEESLNKIKVYRKNGNKTIFLIPTIGANDEITYQILKYDYKKLFVDTISYSVFTEKQSKLNIYESNNKYKVVIGDNDVISGFFVKNLEGIAKSKIEKISPSDLVAMYGVICQNELTELDINKSEGFLSLYSPNAIYINLKVEKSSKENEYILKFASTSSQRDYYPEMLKVNDEEISKDKIIGRLIVKTGNKAELHWVGLHNTKKNKLEFVGDDFLLIRENGGKHPIMLEKCN